MIFAGICALLFGVLFLMSPDLLGKVGDVANRTVLVLDDKISSMRIAAGVVLIAVGLWMLFMALPYGELWYLNIIAAISMFFGLLFVAVPNGLTSLSNVCNTVMLSTDEIVMAVRKTVGILLIIGGIYMLYAVYYMTAAAK
jgi:hypothetical protein